MNSIVEPQRSIPVVKEVDVLVVGGGTAGVPAALCAARLGARTLLVEKFNSLGGAITGGMTITLPPSPVGAALNEIMDRMRRNYGGVAQQDGDQGFIIIDQELYKYESVLALEEAGAEMLLNAFAVDAIVEDGAVRGIIGENKSGRQAIRARVVIDCTGDADVAFRSGAETAIAPNDKLLKTTLMWLAANVDIERARAADQLGGEYTIVHDGEINVWGGAVEGLDATDAWALSAAENETRKQSVREWLKRRAEWAGWERSYIGYMAPHLGVRETRRLVGVHIVTKNEHKTADYADTIGTTQYGEQFPYRALVPREMDGLLVAGRCASTDADVQHSLRIAPTCALLGEAAGTAAALSLDQGVEPRRVAIAALRKQLEKQGVSFAKPEGTMA